MSEYLDRSRRRLEEIRNKEDMVILAIESSCDETAAAVTRGRSVLSNVIASQIDIHKRYGGVVPEIASRNHTLAIKHTVARALEESGVSLNDVDCIAVTYGAGLLGALLVGVSYAKALAYAADKPLIPVNHIKGHIAVNYVADPTLEPPFVCLIASGGHTAIALADSLTHIEIVGQTRDDACGEAFDKVARVLGLPYPGGPKIEEAARGGRPVVEMPTPYKNTDTFDFSFSGLKTAVINYVHNRRQKGEEVSVADVACSFQTKAVEILVGNAVRACEKYGARKLVIGGGVGANGVLRKRVAEECEMRGIRAFYPPIKLCTDNAVMIAAMAYNTVKSGGDCADFDLDADADVRITD